jgi:hypothetical protein
MKIKSLNHFIEKNYINRFILSERSIPDYVVDKRFSDVESAPSEGKFRHNYKLTVQNINTGLSSSSNL